MTLDDNKTASVNKTADRTAGPGGPVRTRGMPQPDLQIDLQLSVITDLHFSVDIGTRRSRP